jgi:ribosomal protein L21E
VRLETKSISVYVCETCGQKHEYEADAVNCEQSHYKYNVGDKVWFDDGSYGTEHGRPYPSWHPHKVCGTVVEVDIDMCLVENEKGERKWRHHWSIDTEKESKIDTPAPIKWSEIEGAST